MSQSKYKVLIADDSAEDRFFMRKMLERSSKLVIIGEARDGQEALDYLTQSGGFKDVSEDALPDILVLDLKMPRKDGYDVLTWLKDQPIQNLIVAVMSGSCLAEDITRSMALGAHNYFTKTSIREEQDVIVQSLEALVEKTPKS